ncbi:hypothetical protein GGX14DRAFT_438785 [Mycena pura]|uniref:Uncharacterized protein n=1 Tax=Mycena pura TaxID=153505 RepID=A0AAD6VN05_9AGAR|nr:hypothetical protein GGX14DRAFT_438785 [Mycena pura]
MGRKREFSEAIGRFRREAHGAGGVGLLDDEGFDDDSVPMRRYHDNVASHTRSGSASTSQLSLNASSPAPSVFRQRAETGSAFREEVYPPPQQFVDPLVGLGAGFGSIVEDVLGPRASTAPLPLASNANAPPISSANTTSISGPPPSTTSMPPPYAEPHADGPTSSMYADPFRDLSRSTSPRDPSLYYQREGSSSSSGSSPATPQSLLGLPAGTGTAPKKSSPLVNTSASSNPSNWLTRSPKKRAHGLSEN